MTASYEETTTVGEINSVTFEEEQSKTEVYNCETDPETRVCALWQLVDEFSFVDADMVPIHKSDILRHAVIDELPSIKFPSEQTFAQMTTRLD